MYSVKPLYVYDWNVGKPRLATDQEIWRHCWRAYIRRRYGIY